MRRMAVALATLCLLAGQIMFAGVVSGASPAKFTATPLTPDSTFTGTKSSSGAIAKSDPALLGRTDATPVNVMIKYDYDATATYAGGIDGLAATSPAVTGVDLKDNAGAVQAYDAYTAGVSSEITADAQAAVPALTVDSTFSTAYGGVSATVPANQIGALLKVDGVVAVAEVDLAQSLRHHHRVAAVGREVHVVRVDHRHGASRNARSRVDRRQRVALVVGDPQGPEVVRRHNVLRQRVDRELADHPIRARIDLVDGVATTVRHVDQRPIAPEDRRQGAGTIGRVDVPRIQQRRYMQARPGRVRLSGCPRRRQPRASFVGGATAAAQAGENRQSGCERADFRAQLHRSHSGGRYAITRVLYVAPRFSARSSSVAARSSSAKAQR